MSTGIVRERESAHGGGYEYFGCGRRVLYPLRYAPRASISIDRSLHLSFVPCQVENKLFSWSYVPILQNQVDLEWVASGLSYLVISGFIHRTYSTMPNKFSGNCKRSPICVTTSKCEIVSGLIRQQQPKRSAARLASRKRGSPSQC